MVGVIVGAIEAAGPYNLNTTIATTQALRVASVAIFLFLTIVQALQTGILATSSVSGMQNQLF